MDKETSSRVSSLAANILNLPLYTEGENPPLGEINALLKDAKTVAGSVLSQDQTPGQEQPTGDFFSRLKDEREDLDRRLTALNSYLFNNPGHPNPRHFKMLEEQSKLMSDLLAVLDERIADIEISRRSDTEIQ